MEHRRTFEDDIFDPGWDQAVEKFHSLTGNLLDASTPERILAIVGELEPQKSIDALIQRTRRT